MFDVLGNALSSARAHARGMLLHAYNTANVETPGFEAGRVTYSSDEAGDVTANIEFPPDAGPTNLVDETVGTTSSRRAVEANLAVIRNSDKMLGIVVDTFV